MGLSLRLIERGFGDFFNERRRKIEFKKSLPEPSKGSMLIKITNS